MIKMKDLIKQQNDMIRKESGMNVKEDQLDEAQQHGVDFDYGDHYKLAKSMKHNFDADIGYSESADLYGWKDQKNFKAASNELIKHVLKSIAPYAKALEKWKQKSRMFHDDKDKIFNKWRKKDGSEQYD
jgi:hypothetical protein